MPILFDPPPPPRFDSSIISFLARLATGAKSAFSKAWPTDYQTGYYDAVYAASSVVLTNIFYGRDFDTTTQEHPFVVVTPHYNSTYHNMQCLVTAATNNVFVLRATCLDGNITDTIRMRWVAWLP